MFAPILTRIAEKCDCWPQKSDLTSPLRPEDFPLEARGREIVTRNGAVVAATADHSMSQELVVRLNAAYWSSLEDEWAL